MTWLHRRSIQTRCRPASRALLQSQTFPVGAFSWQKSPLSILLAGFYLGVRGIFLRLKTKAIAKPPTACHPEQVRATLGSEDASKDPCTPSFVRAASGNSHHNPAPLRRERA